MIRERVIGAVVLVVIIAAGDVTSVVSAPVKGALQGITSASSEEETVRALRRSSEMKNPDDIDRAVALLDDRRSLVRIEAAVTLGLLKDKRALNALHNALLLDMDPAVRYAALLAVLDIGSPDSHESLRQSYRNDQDPYIKDLLGKLRKKFTKENWKDSK